MPKPTTLFVGLDSHKEFISVAHAEAQRSDPPVFVGGIGTRQADIDTLVRRLHSKATHLVFACEAGPTGYGLFRYLTAKGLECRVSRNGGVRWRSQWLNVGHALIEQNVGFHEVADGIWDVSFGPLQIGRFDERTLRLVGTLATHYRCGKRGDRRHQTQQPEPARGDLHLSHSTTAATGRSTRVT